jgi:hypothetical protein
MVHQWCTDSGSIAACTTALLRQKLRCIEGVSTTDDSPACESNPHLAMWGLSADVRLAGSQQVLVDSWQYEALQKCLAATPKC